MGQFDWTPDDYLERIRSEIPRYDELQEQAMAAIPFPPERVLELGMGTGETTRRLIEAHPDAWVIGLDASPDMVFRARQTYDDVQLARMEDPLPDGPWDLVISVLSVSELDDEQREPLPPGQRALPLPRHRRRLRADAGHLIDAIRSGAQRLAEWCGGEVTWQARRLARACGPSPTEPAPATIPRPMAVPKKRTSSARRDKRRANHKAGKARLNSCPRCHSPRLPHRVCPTCGTYAGREVIATGRRAPATPTDSE